jgi:hypothetical protein
LLRAGAMAEVARVTYAGLGVTAPQPAVLETLPVAIRKGLDTPDKIAFAYRRPSIRSRSDQVKAPIGELENEIAGARQCRIF